MNNETRLAILERKRLQEHLVVARETLGTFPGAWEANTASEIIQRALKPLPPIKSWSLLELAETMFDATKAALLGCGWVAFMAWTGNLVMDGSPFGNWRDLLVTAIVIAVISVVFYVVRIRLFWRQYEEYMQPPTKPVVVVFQPEPTEDDKW